MPVSRTRTKKPVPKKAPPKKRAPGAGRRQVHPWDEIDRLYIQGEDVEKAGKGGVKETVREWPTMTALVNRFNLRMDTLSKRFSAKNHDGKTAHERQKAFKVDLTRQLETKLAEELAEREVGFRLATMAIAEQILRQAALNLSRPQGGDGLAKLSGAAKRAQEIGMVALDRPANGPSGEGGTGGEDWTLMRKVRTGGVK